MKVKIKSIVREPLVHFLLIGLLLFLIYGKAAPPSDEGRRITVDKAVIAGLVGQFNATWSRPPTRDELNGLIESHVRDEILYREGVALGLDKGDPVIKRRLRQKLEVLIEEQGNTAAPTDAELAAYLQQHADRFRQPPVLSFEQVLFNPAEYGDRLEAAMAASKAALGAGAAPASQGSGSMLPARIHKQPLDLVAREFGGELGDALASAPVGQWVGPVRSGFGLHLVRVTERIPGYLPSLAQARKAVSREWESDRRKAALESNYADLRKAYRIVIEGPDATASAR